MVPSYGVPVCFDVPHQNGILQHPSFPHQQFAPRLCNNLIDNIPVHIRQSEVAAGVFVGELFMVDS